MRCRPCRYMWAINEMYCYVGICRGLMRFRLVSICGGLIRCKLCRFMWRINEM